MTEVINLGFLVENGRAVPVGDPETMLMRRDMYEALKAAVSRDQKWNIDLYSPQGLRDLFGLTK